MSEAWRLDSIKGLRADDNLYAKYMAGAYGAIPQVELTIVNYQITPSKKNSPCYGRR